MNRPLTQLQLRLIDKRVIQVYQSIEELPIKDTKQSNRILKHCTGKDRNNLRSNGFSAVPLSNKGLTHYVRSDGTGLNINS